MVAAACIAGAAVAVAIAVIGTNDKRAEAEREVKAQRPAVDRALASDDGLAVFRSDDRRRLALFGHLAVAPVRDGRPGMPRIAGPSCVRVAFEAGHGLCTEVTNTGVLVRFLDAKLRVTGRLEVPGIPSRARISPDGRWGGITNFLTGHGYGAPGTFSTAAKILDLRTRKEVADLEADVKVRVDGEVLDARDRNYWGLTFAGDGDTYYATAASGGRTWLIRGSIRTATATAIHENVECPALSPDGTRIAYKKATAPNSSAWRFTVLDLASGRETPLAEGRSIDDQLAWLDDETLLYADRDHTTWAVPADGSGRPRVWLRGAESATVSE